MFCVPCNFDFYQLLDKFFDLNPFLIGTRGQNNRLLVTN